MTSTEVKLKTGFHDVHFFILNNQCLGSSLLFPRFFTEHVPAIDSYQLDHPTTDSSNPHLSVTALRGSPFIRLLNSASPSNPSCSSSPSSLSSSSSPSLSPSPSGTHLVGPLPCCVVSVTEHTRPHVKLLLSARLAKLRVIAVSVPLRPRIE